MYISAALILSVHQQTHVTNKTLSNKYSNLNEILWGQYKRAVKLKINNVSEHLKRWTSTFFYLNKIIE